MLFNQEINREASVSNMTLIKGIRGVIVASLMLCGLSNGKDSEQPPLQPTHQPNLNSSQPALRTKTMTSTPSDPEIRQPLSPTRSTVPSHEGSDHITIKSDNKLMDMASEGKQSTVSDFEHLSTLKTMVATSATKPLDFTHKVVPKATDPVSVISETPAISDNLGIVTSSRETRGVQLQNTDVMISAADNIQRTRTLYELIATSTLGAEIKTTLGLEAPMGSVDALKAIDQETPISTTPRLPDDSNPLEYDKNQNYAKEKNKENDILKPVSTPSVIPQSAKETKPIVINEGSDVLRTVPSLVTLATHPLNVGNPTLNPPVTENQTLKSATKEAKLEPTKSFDGTMIPIKTTKSQVIIPDNATSAFINITQLTTVSSQKPTLPSKDVHANISTTTVSTTPVMHGGSSNPMPTNVTAIIPTGNNTTLANKGDNDTVDVTSPVRLISPVPLTTLMMSTRQTLITDVPLLSVTNISNMVTNSSKMNNSTVAINTTTPLPQKVSVTVPGLTSDVRNIGTALPIPTVPLTPLNNQSATFNHTQPLSLSSTTPHSEAELNTSPTEPEFIDYYYDQGYDIEKVSNDTSVNDSAISNVDNKIDSNETEEKISTTLKTIATSVTIPLQPKPSETVQKETLSTTSAPVRIPHRPTRTTMRGYAHTTESILWTILTAPQTSKGSQENEITDLSQQTVIFTTLTNTIIQKTTPVPILTVNPITQSGLFPSKTNPNDINPEPFPTLLVAKPTESIVSPPLYIRIYILMTKLELCRERQNLKDILAVLVGETMNPEKGTVILSKQVILKPLDGVCKGSWRLRRATEVYQVDTYMSDMSGGYSYELTSVLAAALDNRGAKAFTDTRFDGTITDIRVFGGLATVKPADTLLVAVGREPRLGAGAVVGIVSICVLLSVAAAFLGLILLKNWRRRGVKKMRQVSASARPSLALDTHSLAESIQMQAFNRRGSTRYGFANLSLDFKTDDTDLTSNPLTLEDLELIVRQHDVMEDEFLMLPNNLAALSDLPEHTEDKNRYANVIPNPDTRVPLETGVKEGACSYINANFMKGYQGYPKCYIATQAPLESTVYDFWRMVWEQNSSVIIMLTALRENSLDKCKEYWPNTEGGDTTRLYGEFRISQERRIVMPEWIQTTLQVRFKRAKHCKQIQHFWLTSWPSHGLPDYRTFIKFMVKIRPFMDDSAAPPVIHCSPGTGRTGVFIALDIGMLSYEDSSIVNVLNIVHQMRKDRGGMVQTKDQYIFIYKVMVEFAKMLHNPVSSARSSMSSTTSSFR